MSMAQIFSSSFNVFDRLTEAKFDASQVNNVRNADGQNVFKVQVFHLSLLYYFLLGWRTKSQDHHEMGETGLVPQLVKRGVFAGLDRPRRLAD